MPLSNWDINKVLKFSTDHNKVDTTLIDFPVLINLSDSSGKDSYNCSALFTELDYPVDDTFTAASGSTPNTDLWLTVETTNGIVEISNNKLHIAVDTTDASEYSFVRTKYKLTGDFDVQVDFSNYDGGSLTSAGTELRAVISSGVDEFLIKIRQGLTDGIHSRTVINSSYSETYDDRVNDYGKVKLTRVGSTINIYIDDGDTGFILTKTATDSRLAEDVELYLATWCPASNDPATIDLDNFTISGSVVWPQGTFPNRKKLAVQYKGVQEHWVDYIDDEFTGVDNELLNTTTWSGTAVTSGNAVYLSTSDNYMGAVSTYTLTNDFDIQIDFPDLNIQAVDNSGFYFFIKGEEGTRYNIRREYSGSVDQYHSYRDGTQGYLLDGTYASSDTSGKFRITRIGDILSGYRHTGTAWVQIGTGLTITSLDSVLVGFGVGNWGSNPDISGSLDNLKLNYGTIDWQGNEPVKVFRSHTSETQQCYCELVNWNQDNESAQLWVKAPRILYNQPTDFLVYYDSTQDANTTYIGDTGSTIAEGVWDSNFVGVYHMNQDPSGGTDCILDSTSLGNHGTPGGSMTSSDLVDGVAGKAIEFDGVDDWVEIDDVCSYINANSSNLTVSAVIKKPGLPVTGHDVVVSMHGATGNSNRLLFWNVTATNDISVDMLNTSAASIGNNSGTFTNVCDNAYHSVTTTYAQGTDLSSFYTDDKLENAITLTENWLIEADGRASIAQEYDTSTNGDFFGGSMSSVFISKTARSSSWAKATSNTTLDTLFTVEAAPLYSISGYVKELGEPVQRTVYLYDRSTGILMDSGISSETGYYHLYTTTSGEHNLMCLDALADPEFNDLIISKVTPTEVV